MEPTERSMPPVMMTKVMPIARNALRATCFDIRIRLAVERKFGAANEKKMNTAKSAMKVLSFISVSRAEPLLKVESVAAVVVLAVMTRVPLLVCRGRCHAYARGPWPKLRQCQLRSRYRGRIWQSASHC